MHTEQAISRDLASIAPGAELAALLETLTPTQVPDSQIVEVLRATWRQISHLHALYYRAMVEIGHRQPIGPLPDPVDQTDQAWQALDSWHWTTHQISAALTFTGRRTDDEYGVARQLHNDLPLVEQALATGEIDPPKAKVFARYLIDLTSAQSECICRRVLPRAPGWTTGQLAHRLLREVLAIDPGSTRRRYQRAVRRRGVWGYLTEDGTAVLSADGLPPAEAAAAAERLEQLAAAVRAAGHPHTETQLRADLFVRLLDGRYAGFTSDQIIAAMFADPNLAGDDTPTSAPVTTRNDHDPGTPGCVADASPGGEDTAPAGAAPTDHRPAVPSSAADATSDGEDFVATRAGAVPADHQPDVSSSAAEVSPGGEDFVAAPAGAAPADHRAALPSTAAHPILGDAASGGEHADLGADPGPVNGPGPPVANGPVGIEVRIGLSTLLGIDDHPGELPGWGPINAVDARLVTALQLSAEWRFAVLDDEGYLLLGGLVRRRPLGVRRRPGHPDGGGVRRGGVVEIHITASLLTDLMSGSGVPPDWVPVVAEIARRFADRDRDLASLDANPTARLASAGLRRHVQLRDRTCVAPGCRRPARRSDLDHTREHAHGGATRQANLGPLCLAHHRMKHCGGWTLTQPEPGRFCWRAPLGQRYWTRGEPIAPDLPPALPGPHGPPDEPEPGQPASDAGPIFDPAEWEKLREPDPPPGRERGENDETPPF